MTDKGNRLDQVKLADIYSFVGIFLLAVFFCWLLSLAYPEGLVNEETAAYWWQQSNFDWFGPNRLDYYRSILYGAMLGWCTRFSHPTSVLYWINSLIFALDCALVFPLGRQLFASRGTALTLAIAALVFEVVSMRIFYNNLALSPDALLGNLIYLGILLSLIGWMNCSLWLFSSAYAVFGLAAFLKPMGIAIWPIWIPFALLFAIHRLVRSRQKIRALVLCITLLIGPLGIWTTRNYALYGNFKSAAVGGCCLLQRVLPIMTEDEQLFDDPKTNADFHLAAWSYRHACGIDANYVTPEEKTSNNLFKMMTYERYYFYGPARISPFHIIGTLTNAKWRETGFQWITEFQPEHMFKVDAEAGRVACRIIGDHPFDYLRLVAQEYTAMFSPLEAWTNPLYKYQSDPRIAYNYWDTAREGNRPKYPSLYPKKNFPTGVNSNAHVAKLLSVIHKNPVSSGFLTFYYSCQLWISHLIFIGAIVLFAQTRKHPEHFANAAQMHHCALALVMLFLTVAAIFLTTASCQIMRLRYQLAGDMPLHLLFLIGVWLCVPKLARRIAPKLSARPIGEYKLKPFPQK